jgi:hypothetical protein
LKINITALNLQQLLLPCKSGCSFSLYADSVKNPTQYYIYLGLSLVDTVPNNPNHFLYKLLCARLRLSGFRLDGLSKTFGYCKETISKWSKVLNSGNASLTAKTFGFVNYGKITPEVRSYIKKRYIYFKKTGEYSYRKKILGELQDYFELDITGEGIRPVFREADTELDELKKIDSKNASAVELVKDKTPDIEVGCRIISTAPETNTTCGDNTGFEAEARKLSSNFEYNSSINIQENIKPDGILPISGNRPPYTEKFIRHLGLILILPLIAKLTGKLSNGKWICRQVIAQFLIGALNMEQSKTVAKDFFRYFFDNCTSNIQELRSGIYKLATLDYRLELAGSNMRNFIFDTMNKVFYYDPHTKKYTGFLNLLKGYCGSLHQTGKVLISDYIHDTNGNPCFVEHYDSMYDLRTRFFFTQKIFKKLFPENQSRGFTWIIDRGIYGIDTLNEIVKSGDHIITWEKGYKKNGWNYRINSENFIMRLPRNSSTDLKEYKCTYQEQKWKRDTQFRKLIVRVTKKTGRKKVNRKLDVSILCSNHEMTAEKIIRYILRRWLQENDFGYLIKHYGIDQIDSYKNHSYRNLKSKEEKTDFLIKSREFKDLQKQKAKLQIEYGKDLKNRENKIDSFNRRLSKKMTGRKDKQILIASEITAMNKTCSEFSKKTSLKNLNKVIRKLSRYERKSKEIENEENVKLTELTQMLNNKVENCKQNINQIDDKLNSTLKEEYRLNALIEGKYYRLDTASKSILDILRISARNSFYQLLKLDFRPFYDNLRDDHVVLRTLIKAPGKMKTVNGRLFIELFPEGDFPDKTISAVKAFIAVREDKINKYFAGKAMPVTISVHF